MSQPIILIGIGTSGLKVLEQVQNFYYENLGKNKPDHVEYLYLETNKDNEPSSTALKNEIKRVYLSLANMKVMVKGLREKFGDNMTWLPPDDVVVEAGMGAGGLPVVGRTALWGENTEGNNYYNVVQAIKGMHSRLSGPGASSGTNSSPVVFISGSLTGGTGSGIFIDLAYIIRMLIHDIKDLYGLYLLPPKPIQMTGNEIVYANSFGALKALEYLNIGKNEYVLPNDHHTKFKEPPFELTQFLSQSYNDATPALNTLGGLYKMAGLYLFLNIIGLKTKRSERLVDAAGNMQIGMYGTFGLSGIQYPKSQIQQFLALVLGGKLLERWVDRDNYYRAGTPIKIDGYKITTEIDNAFGSILESAFEKMNASGGLSIQEEVQKAVDIISRGIEKDPRAFLFKKLSPDDPSGFYQFLLNKMQQGVDDIIVSISDMTIQSLNNYESLFYVRKQLNTLTDIIKQTLDYWKSMGITQNLQAWEGGLSERVSWILTNKYKFIGESKNVLKDRMLTTIEQLKMHLLFKGLIDIGRNIKRESDPLRTKTLETSIKLPTIEQLDSIIKEIEVTLGRRDEAGDSFVNFDKRRKDIKADVTDQSIPILRIFHSGSFQDEVKIALERYRKEAGTNYLSKDVLAERSGMWGYLVESNEPLKRKLYHDVITKYRDEIDRLDVVHDFEVSKFVKDNKRKAKEYAAKSVSFLLPIHDRTLERSVNIPKVVIGSDKGVIENVIDLLKNEQHFHEFDKKGDHMLVIPELKNLMVFYIEQGNYEPIRDLSYMPRVKTSDEEYPTKIGMSKQKWYGLRNPYLNINGEWGD